jgi:hypothetical protein
MDQLHCGSGVTSVFFSRRWTRMNADGIGVRMDMNMRALIFILLLVAGAAQAQPSLDALTRPMDFEARRASSSNEDLARNGDARGIKKGETLVVADLEGPGVVSSIWMTLGSKDPFEGRSLVLRVYYDGQEQPSVECPLGDFFGLGYGAYANFTSATVNVNSHGRSRACFWRMPFRERVRITVENTSSAYDLDSLYWYVNWEKRASLPEETLYFHARYRQQHPAQPGNHVLLDVQGKGTYVGTIYSVLQMETGWFGEGDDFFYIDGAPTPQLRGTGTEDYFNDAWGFRPFCTPYAGVTVYEGVFPGDRVSAYRWHIADPIPFTSSLRVEMEHKGSIYNEQGSIADMSLGNFEERADWVSSVALWYQYPPVGPAEPLSPVAERMPPHTVLQPASLKYTAEPAFMVVPADGGLMYVPNKAGAKLSLELNIAEPGRYAVYARCFKSIMSGVYQPGIDGKPVGGPVDFSILNADYVWLRLDTPDFTAGTHTLEFTGVEGVTPEAARLPGKNLHGLGVGQIVLVRLDACAGYRAVTNRLLGRTP